MGLLDRVKDSLKTPTRTHEELMKREMTLNEVKAEINSMSISQIQERNFDNVPDQVRRSVIALLRNQKVSKAFDAIKDDGRPSLDQIFTVIDEISPNSPKIIIPEVNKMLEILTDPKEVSDYIRIHFNELIHHSTHHSFSDGTHTYLAAPIPQHFHFRGQNYNRMGEVV